MKPLFAIFAAAAVSVGAAKALGAFGDGAPTVAAPLPIPLVLCAFCCGIPFALLPFLPAAAFLAWQPAMFQLVDDITSAVPLPLRTWILLTGVSILSLAGFLGGWEYGVTYQGVDFVRHCAWISASLATASAILCAIATWSQNIFANLLAHGVLFYWAVSYAFPYLGELP